MMFKQLLAISILSLLSACAHQPTPEERLQERAMQLFESYLDLMRDNIEEQRQQIKKNHENQKPYKGL